MYVVVMVVVVAASSDWLPCSLWRHAFGARLGWDVGRLPTVRNYCVVSIWRLPDSIPILRVLLAPSSPSLSVMVIEEHVSTGSGCGGAGAGRGETAICFAIGRGLGGRGGRGDAWLSVSLARATLVLRHHDFWRRCCRPGKQVRCLFDLQIAMAADPVVPQGHGLAGAD